MQQMDGSSRVTHGPAGKPINLGPSPLSIRVKSVEYVAKMALEVRQVSGEVTLLENPVIRALSAYKLQKEPQLWSSRNWSKERHSLAWRILKPTS